MGRRRKRRREEEEGRRKKRRIRKSRFGTHVWNFGLEFMFGAFLFVSMVPMYGFIGLETIITLSLSMFRLGTP